MTLPPEDRKPATKAFDLLALVATWLRFSDAGPGATVRQDAQWTRVGKPPKDEGAGVLVIPMGKVR